MALDFNLAFPQRQIIPHTSHNSFHIIQMTILNPPDIFDTGIKRFFDNTASLELHILDLIEKNTLIQGQPKSDGVCGVQTFLCQLGSIIVTDLCTFRCLVIGIGLCILRQVPEIVSLHLLVENS
jgi:hypothetical protein